MITRILLPLLALAVASASGQTGLYGPVTTHLKAGDPAPDIAFTSMISAPAPGSWSNANLTGQLTVLAFFPDTSHNPKPVAEWNALVARFAHKPVQFLWITGEKDATLQPFLNQHPIKGWVFHDPAGQTGSAYGLEIPEAILIGPDRKLIGFDESVLPGEELLNAALEGRITTTRPTSKTIDQFIASKQIYLNPESRRMPRADDHRPDFPPSYTVHIAPSHTETRDSAGSETFRSLRGFTLKEAIEDAYGINPIRVHLPPALDDHKRYDLALVLPEREDDNQMKLRLQQGIQSYFHLTARHEDREADVYVLTALPGHQPPRLNLTAADRMMWVSSSSMDFQAANHSEDTPEDPPAWPKPFGIDSLRGISTEGTANELCHQLEGQLDRPVVNESNLQGEFKFHVESSEGETNDFLQRLHDQLGLLLTPSQRNVDILVFDPQ